MLIMSLHGFLPFLSLYIVLSASLIFHKYCLNVLLQAFMCIFTSILKWLQNTDLAIKKLITRSLKPKTFIQQAHLPNIQYGPDTL